MKSELQYERLFDDVLLDDDLRAWQQEVLHRCYDQLQQRRLRRFSLAGVAGIAAVLLLTLMLSHPVEQPHIDIDETYLVRTTHLSEQQIIHTASTEHIVQTQSMAGQQVATVFVPDLVVTRQTRIARISDTDMLNEFKGIPCGILHKPDGSAQFVFFRPEDTSRFFHH